MNNQRIAPFAEIHKLPISFTAQEVNLLRFFKNLNYIPIEAILMYLPSVQFSTE